jgi:methylglutaconyl-CoA hydratase
MYRYLQVRRDGPVEYLTLNRPEVRNAFNDEVVAELSAWAATVAADTGVRVVVMAGAGKVFSAGADAAWMARMADATADENERDALATTAMLAAINALPLVVIGRMHGAALGGGSGLAAVCDIVVAAEGTVFGFTETKLGILPAMISPFVLPKIGMSAARALFLTGERFDAARALTIGLVHAVVPAESLEAAVQAHVTEALAAAPSAVAAAKALLPHVWGRRPDEVAALTARTIAAQRVSVEGQEGLRAFLAKRQPFWVSP